MLIWYNLFISKYLKGKLYMYVVIYSVPISSKYIINYNISFWIYIPIQV